MLLSRAKITSDGRLVTKDMDISDYYEKYKGYLINGTSSDDFVVQRARKGTEKNPIWENFLSRRFNTVSQAKNYIDVNFSRSQDSITEGSKIVVNTENHVNESAIAVTINESDCLVRFENGDEETIPIEAVSAFESMANDKICKDDARFVEEYKGYKIYKTPIGLRAIPNGGGESIDDIRYGGGDLIELRKKIDRKNRGQDQEPDETNSQIAELTKNMDKARARGYDTSAYVKEIKRLKSKDEENNSNVRIRIRPLGSNFGEGWQFIQQKFSSKEEAENWKRQKIAEGNLDFQYEIVQDKYTGDPLTEKGQEILANLKKEYGDEKGEQVFYAMRNAGKIEGVDLESKDTKDSKKFVAVLIAKEGTLFYGTKNVLKSDPFDSEEQAQAYIDSLRESPSFGTYSIETVNETGDAAQWGMFQSGGSIGENYDPNKPIKTGTEQEMKEAAKRWNAMLSPGEKSYYKIKYFARLIR